MDGGVETTSHFISAATTDAKLKYAAISADQQNAFNSRERSKMLGALYEDEKLAPLWRLAAWSYSDATPLCVRNNNGVIVCALASRNGARQGCVLGSILYALSMKEIFTEVARTSPDVHALAIADDFTIIGPPSDALRAYRKFVELCDADGSVTLNKKKSFFLLFPRRPAR